MKTIKEDAWRYVLFQDDEGRACLDVVCGRVGLFIRRVILSPDEATQAIASDSYAVELARRIEKDPAEFEGRYTDNPKDMPPRMA